MKDATSIQQLTQASQEFLSTPNKHRVIRPVKTAAFSHRKNKTHFDREGYVKASYDVSSNRLHHKLSKCMEKERMLTFSEDELYKYESEYHTLPKVAQGVFSNAGIVMSKQKVQNAHRLEPSSLEPTNYQNALQQSKDLEGSLLSSAEKRTLISHGHINRMLQPTMSLRQSNYCTRPKTGGNAVLPNEVVANGFFSPLQT
jgi:hypothetical protein